MAASLLLAFSLPVSLHAAAQDNATAIDELAEQAQQDTGDAAEQVDDDNGIASQSCPADEEPCQLEGELCPEGEECEPEITCLEGEEGCLTDEAGEEFADEDARDLGRFQPVADIVEAGGPIIVILGVISVISLAIIVVKLLQFFLLRIGDHKFSEKAAEMFQQGKKAKALDYVASRRGVIARVMETAIRGRIRGGDMNQVREEVERVARAKLDGLERGLPLLSLIATVSPLLGLLGTVLGMIEAFQQLENAGDRVDPAILSGGIWEALLTTAAGLSVAIPAAAFFTWLQRSVDVAGQYMEDAATRIFTAELYQEPRAKAASSDDNDD